LRGTRTQDIEWEGDELILRLLPSAGDAGPEAFSDTLNRVLEAVALHLPTTAIASEAPSLHTLFVRAVAADRFDGEEKTPNGQEVS
jgi:hypothetical protein